jgi:hypothetical protein
VESDGQRVGQPNGCVVVQCRGGVVVQVDESYRLGVKKAIAYGFFMGGASCHGSFRYARPRPHPPLGPHHRLKMNCPM